MAVTLYNDRTMCRKCTKKRGITCTLTRPLSARIADANSFSPPASRSSTLRRASPTSPRDAAIAVTLARHSVVRALLLLARDSRLFALSAVRPARFPSSPATTVPSTATTASATETTNLCKHRNAKNAKNTARWAVFFVFWGYNGCRGGYQPPEKLKSI